MAPAPFSRAYGSAAAAQAAAAYTGSPPQLPTRTTLPEPLTFWLTRGLP